MRIVILCLTMLAVLLAGCGDGADPGTTMRDGATPPHVGRSEGTGGSAAPARVRIVSSKSVSGAAVEWTWTIRSEGAWSRIETTPSGITLSAFGGRADTTPGAGTVTYGVSVRADEVDAGTMRVTRLVRLSGLAGEVEMMGEPVPTMIGTPITDHVHIDRDGLDDVALTPPGRYHIEQNGRATVVMAGAPCEVPPSQMAGILRAVRIGTTTVTIPCHVPLAVLKGRTIYLDLTD